MTAPVHLYVYYETEANQLPACLRASQTLLGQMEIHAGVQTELLQRADEMAKQITIMEVLRCKPLSAEGRQQLIAQFDRLAQAQFVEFNGQVERHLEVFLPACPQDSP